VGHITKNGFEGWFAELVEYHKKNSTVKVGGLEQKKNPQLGKWGNYAKIAATAVTMQDAC
jgi:hypothetical protein